MDFDIFSLGKGSSIQFLATRMSLSQRNCSMGLTSAVERLTWISVVRHPNVQRESKSIQAIWMEYFWPRAAEFALHKSLSAFLMPLFRIDDEQEVNIPGRPVTSVTKVTRRRHESHKT